MAQYKIKLKKGDTVMVRRGSEKGKTGKVTETHPTHNKVTVEGVNIVKRHVKPSNKFPKGGIIEQAMPVHVSSVGIVHPSDKKKTSRIGMKQKKDGTFVRVYRQADEKEIK